MTDEINWYAEASLSASDHVYCAGSLAQCVRKWIQLTETQRSATRISMHGPTGKREIVRNEQIALLAQIPGLSKV